MFRSSRSDWDVRRRYSSVPLLLNQAVLTLRYSLHNASAIAQILSDTMYCCLDTSGHFSGVTGLEAMANVRSMVCRTRSNSFRLPLRSLTWIYWCDDWA